MAYNNYYPAGYQPAYYPQMQQPQMQTQPQQTNTDIKWVQGEAAAKSYPVAPNTSVTLWDHLHKLHWIHHFFLPSISPNFALRASISSLR